MLPDFEHFSGEAMSSVASPDSLKALLCGSADGSRDRLSSQRHQLAHGFFGSRVLDP
jgi:hypothetical protein